MGAEALFREALPELFERPANLRALGDAMLAAEGNEARGGAIARLCEAALQLWVRGEVKTSGVEQWLDFGARVRKALAAARSDARGRRIAVFTSAGPVAAAVQLAAGVDDETGLSPAFRRRNSSGRQCFFNLERFSPPSLNRAPPRPPAALAT